MFRMWKTEVVIKLRILTKGCLKISLEKINVLIITNKILISYLAFVFKNISKKFNDRE